MSSEEKNIRLLDKRLDMLFNSKEFTNALKVFNLTLSQRHPINAGRARPTDIFVTYLRFSKRYVDENSTIRISVKIYTNS